MAHDPREQSGFQRFAETLLSGFGDVARDAPAPIRRAKQQERLRKRQDLQDLVSSERLRFAQENRANEQAAFERAQVEGVADRASTIRDLIGGDPQNLLPSGNRQFSINPDAFDPGRSLESLTEQRDFERGAPKRELARQSTQALIGSRLRANQPKAKVAPGATDGVSAGAKRRVVFVSEEFTRQKNTQLDNIQSGLQAKGVKFSSNDLHKDGTVKFAALKREALKFFNPKGDRPGIGFFEESVDPSFMQAIRDFEDFQKTGRKAVSDDLETTFPSLSGGIDAQIANMKKRIAEKKRKLGQSK